MAILFWAFMTFFAVSSQLISPIRSQDKFPVKDVGLVEE
jgi:hypothetical protein